VNNPKDVRGALAGIKGVRVKGFNATFNNILVIQPWVFLFILY
jgi:hypothetical protein